jgi:hypothetical protein
MDHASIRSLLSNRPFQKMRQNSGCHDAKDQVIRLTLLTLVAAPRCEPETRSDDIKGMFIGCPGQKLSRALHRRAGITNNSLGNASVELRCAEIPTEHFHLADSRRPPLISALRVYRDCRHTQTRGNHHRDRE